MAIFLDASYFLALYNENDVHHKRAKLVAEEIDSNQFGQAITSDDIFDEVVSVALRKLSKDKAQVLGRQILESIFIIHGDKHIFDLAFMKFTKSRENFSFTDCTSLAIMELAQIQYLATFDKLFEKLNIKIIN